MKRLVHRLMIMISAGALFWTANATAEVLLHEGAPPRGFAFVDLESAGDAEAPVQFAGTTNPPFLLMNGKPVHLKKFEDESGASTAGNVKFGSTSADAEGKHGRFFLQMSKEEAAVPVIPVRMKTPSGKILGADVVLNRVFIEAPIKIRNVITADEAKASAFSFQLGGRLAEGFALDVKDARVTRDGDRVTVSVRLPVGKTVLVAHLKQPNGTVKIIDVPVKVSKSEYADENAVFTLSLPDGTQLPLVIPRGGLTVSGETNAGALLDADGMNIPVQPDGKFTALIRGNDKTNEIAFRVQPKNSPLAEFKIPAVSRDDTAYANAAPVAAAPSKYFLILNFEHSTLFNFSGGNLPYTVGSFTGPINFMFGAGIGRIISDKLTADFRINKYNSTSSDPTIGQYWIHVNFAKFSAGVNYYPWEHLAVGADLDWFIGDLQWGGFSLSENHIGAVTIGAHVQGNWKISRGWSYAPRIEYDNSSVSVVHNEFPLNWDCLTLELLGFTYRF